jgi:hypothetical protein
MRSMRSCQQQARIFLRCALRSSYMTALLCPALPCPALPCPALHCAALTALPLPALSVLCRRYYCTVQAHDTVMLLTESPVHPSGKGEPAQWIREQGGASECVLCAAAICERCPAKLCQQEDVLRCLVSFMPVREQQGALRHSQTPEPILVRADDARIAQLPPPSPAGGQLRKDRRWNPHARPLRVCLHAPIAPDARVGRLPPACRVLIEWTTAVHLSPGLCV